MKKRRVINIEAAKIILCIALFLESLIDIRIRRVCIWLPILTAGAGVLCAIINDSLSLQELMLDFGITAIFFTISKVSKEALGIGDVWVIGSILIVMGVMDGIGILFLSFLLAAVYGGVLWAKNKRKDGTFPFVPFLFLGTIGGVWIG